MKVSLRFRIIFASACAVLAALLGLSYADAVKAEAQQERNEAIARYGGDVVSVAVANRQLKAGDVIQEGDVTSRDWVLDLVPEGAITSTDDLVGKKLSAPVAKNGVLTDACFQKSGQTMAVPDGLVGISIPVSDKLGISADTAQGTKLVAYEVGKGGSEQIGDSVVLLSSLAQTAEGENPESISLAVKGADVDRILSASAAGTLSFVLPANGANAKDLGSTKVSKDPVQSTAPAEVTGSGGESAKQDDADKSKQTTTNATSQSSQAAQTANGSGNTGTTEEEKK